MSIAPLPTPVPAATGRGAARAAGSGADGSDPTADVFATLVEAVLAAASGGAATGDATASGPDAAVPGTPEGAPRGGVTEPVAAEAQLVGRDAAGDATQAGSTDPDVATAAEDASDAAATPDPAVASTTPVALTLPLTSPALAAALGLTRLPRDQGPTQAPGPSPSPSQAPADAVAEAPSTGTPGGDLSVTADPAMGALSSGPPLPLHDPVAPSPAGRHADGTSTDAARMTPPASSERPADPTDGTAPTPAGRHADATSTDAARMTPPASSERPTDPTDGTAPTPAGRHADATSTDAARMTSHETRTGDGRHGDATGPTLVPGVSGAEAPARAAEAPPTTVVTRSAAAQVVPELTRLVQAGPGTHRMVLRLDPEHLGEVRITLTVHPGGVRVRMAAGSEDARVALHDGLPELQRALGAASGRPAGETQVAVLHQPAGQQPQQPPQGTAYDGGAPSAQTDAGQASDHQTPGDRPQSGDRDAGRPARTQVDTTARDGSQGAGTPRPADPPTSHRGTTARLDVSM